MHSSKIYWTTLLKITNEHYIIWVTLGQIFTTQPLLWPEFHDNEIITITWKKKTLKVTVILYLLCCVFVSFLKNKYTEDTSVGRWRKVGNHNCAEAPEKLQIQFCQGEVEIRRQVSDTLRDTVINKNTKKVHGLGKCWGGLCWFVIGSISALQTVIKMLSCWLMEYH